MRMFWNTELLGDVFKHQKLIEDVRITRISPRSYYAGETSGFTVGITVGIVIGIVLTCAFYATL